jgi:hypothetical protein
MFHSPWVVLTVVTAVAPGAVWALLWLGRNHSGPLSPRFATLLGLAQFGVLGINAASRQVVQHLEIGPYYNLLNQPTATQWSPLLIFLAVFILGLGLVAWMIWQVAKLPAKTDASVVPRN